MKEELISFASCYKRLQPGLLDQKSDIETESEIDSNDEMDTDIENDTTGDKDINDKIYTRYNKPKKFSESTIKKKVCKDCFSCAFKCLYKYKLYSAAYENLYAAYKYLLTLSIAQCTCERTFSKLKIIKSRLRSRLTQNHLESLMLISVEKTIARKLRNDKESIIDRFANTSKELSALLLF